MESDSSLVTQQDPEEAQAAASSLLWSFSHPSSFLPSAVGLGLEAGPKKRGSPSVTIPRKASQATVLAAPGGPSDHVIRAEAPSPPGGAGGVQACGDAGKSPVRYRRHLFYSFERKRGRGGWRRDPSTGSLQKAGLGRSWAWRRSLTWMAGI